MSDRVAEQRAWSDVIGITKLIKWGLIRFTSSTYRLAESKLRRQHARGASVRCLYTNAHSIGNKHVYDTCIWLHSHWDHREVIGWLQRSNGMATMTGPA